VPGSVILVPVTAAQGPARRRLILAAVGLACVAVVVIALWILSGYAGSHTSATSGDTQVSATVRTSASCTGSDNNDTISFRIAGAIHLAKLDGCGHQPGETMDVLVPAAYNGNTVLAMADAAPGDSSGLSHRVAFLLLVLATGVGGMGGYQIFRIRNGAAGPLASRLARPSIRETGPMRFGSRVSVDDRPSGRLLMERREPGRLASRFRPATADREEVYPGESGKARRKGEPGVDWFEDSSATMRPVERPVDLRDRPE